MRAEDEKNLASAKSKARLNKGIEPALRRELRSHNAFDAHRVYAISAGGLDDCHLTVVGGGVALEHWKQLVTTQNLSGKVTFTGPVTRDRLPGLWRRCRCVGVSCIAR